MSKKRVMSTYSSASQVHRKSEELRESDKHTEALKFIEEAIVGYQREKNYEGLSRALQSRFLIYKHLFLLTRDEAFAILGQKDVESSLAITQKNNLLRMLSSCYFRLGESAMLFKNYKNAVDNYQKAVDQYEGSNSEKGDYRYHLGEALYRSGEKIKGEAAMLQGLREIQNNANEVDSFLIHVWESGCYMKLAELLRDEKNDQARKSLERAKEIAQSDKKLIIRRRQIEDIAKMFQYS